MSDGIKITVLDFKRLPWPPSLNRIYKRVGSKVYLTDEGREYKVKVRMMVQRWAGTYVRGERLAVSIRQVVPTRVKRKHDVDNLNKLLLDAFSDAHVWLDDSQVKMLLNWQPEPLAPNVKHDGFIQVRIQVIDQVEDLLAQHFHKFED